MITYKSIKTMQREKIIDIAKYRGINELICKQCGTVTPVESCVIFEHTQVNHVVKIRANCPECEAFIQWLPSRKAWRIFKNKNSGMVEIEKLDNGYLEWYLKTIEKVPEDLAAAIQELINRRTTDPAAFIAPPPDIDTKKIIELTDRQRFLIAEINLKRSINSGLVRDLDPGANSTEVKKIQNKLKFNAQNINALQKELTRVKFSIVKLEKD